MVFDIFCMFVNVLMYKVQFISFVYLIRIKMHDFRKVYCVENFNVFIMLRYFHNIVVYFIKKIKIWRCLVYHHLILFSFSFGTTGNKQYTF